MKFNSYMKSISQICIFMILYHTTNCITTKNQKIAEQVLNNLKTNQKQFIAVNNDVNNCACARVIPQCCTPEYFKFNCNCVQLPACVDPCQNAQSIEAGNSFVNMHDSMMKVAMNDAYSQADLANKAMMQVKLFNRAQNFAKEMGKQELKAKQYANVLKDLTIKAQNKRLMLFQEAHTVKLLTIQALKDIVPIDCFGSKCAVQVNQQIPTGIMTGYQFKEKNSAVENNKEKILKKEEKHLK